MRALAQRALALRELARHRRVRVGVAALVELRVQPPRKFQVRVGVGVADALAHAAAVATGAARLRFGVEQLVEALGLQPVGLLAVFGIELLLQLHRESLVFLLLLQFPRHVAILGGVVQLPRQLFVLGRLLLGEVAPLLLHPLGLGG